jgi:hypothetical protein
MSAIQRDSFPIDVADDTSITPVGEEGEAIVRRIYRAPGPRQQPPFSFCLYNPIYAK